MEEKEPEYECPDCGELVTMKDPKCPLCGLEFEDEGTLELEEGIKDELPKEAESGEMTETEIIEKEPIVRVGLEEGLTRTEIDDLKWAIQESIERAETLVETDTEMPEEEALKAETEIATEEEVPAGDISAIEEEPAVAEASEGIELEVVKSLMEKKVVFSENKLMRLKKAELIEISKDLGLATSGKKADLVERIMENAEDIEEAMRELE